jgi:LmbE family N-acetylglucosaminyl deacetylase
MLKHRSAGGRLYWAIVTAPQQPRWDAQTIARKSAEVDSVAAAYGVEKSFRLGYPALRLDTVARADLVESLRGVITEVRPETLYVVHHGDVHTDHHAVFDATTSALRPSAMAECGVRRVLCYECLSSTDAAPPLPHRAFLANCYSDITAYLEPKLAILARYETELQPANLPRHASAVRALARLRGATIGVEYAEAFALIRERC